jgi:hypothetical protein
MHAKHDSIKNNVREITNFDLFHAGDGYGKPLFEVTLSITYAFLTILDEYLGDGLPIMQSNIYWTQGRPAVFNSTSLSNFQLGVIRILIVSDFACKGARWKSNFKDMGPCLTAMVSPPYLQR